MKEQETRDKHRGIEKIPQRLLGPAVVLIAAGVATAPLLINGFSCGHDFDFHLVSWMDALNAWRHGVFYPHWTASANFNAGEPRFVFYPPLTWMLGAALGAIFGWQLAPILLTFLLLAATGLAVRALARLALDEAPATLAGCFAIFSGYALFCVYERAAYGELAGGCTIPLVLLLALRRQRSMLPLVLAIAVSWLANAPVGVMACYLLAAVALLAAFVRRSWTPALRAAAAVALGLGLTAFYLVPAAVEQKWADIREATDDPGLQIENSFLFAHHASQQLADHDIELHKTSLIAAAMLILAFAAIAICIARKRLPGERGFWLPLAMIPLVVLLLLLPISLPVWNLLPKLRFLQFPWRWLVVLEAPLGIFLACAVWPAVQKQKRWVRIPVVVMSATACIAMSAFAGVRFHQQCDDEDAIVAMAAHDRIATGFIGTDEYAPQNADNTIVAEHLPAACLVSDPTAELGTSDANPDDTQPVWSRDQHSCQAVFDFSTEAGRAAELHREVHGVAPQAGELIVRLRRYPAWRMTLNGRQVEDEGRRDDGLMVVPVAAGQFDLAADWVTTGDERIGQWISLATLIAVIVLAVAQFRRTKDG